MDKLAEFIRKHPWWQWLTRTPFSAKMTKYALSSAIAFGLSNLAFAFCYWLGWGTTVPSVIAFFAAAIPNWIMNRRWAWQQTGRAPRKQIISYAAVSAVVLLVTAYSTGRVNHWVKYDINVANHQGLRLLIVTAAFVIINVVLFFAKFAVYEYLIFPGRRRGADRRRPDDDEGPRSGGGFQLGAEQPVDREPALSSGPAA
ncbi:MAG: GtrA family protein [Solirubrobacteraceae bacterium]